MTLPTFLGIGVLRGGTTWLHELLASHPEVYVPTRRKELYFFDRYFERGPTWYERFFPKGDKADSYRAIGEITPTYFYDLCCPERIASVPSITRLVLILRNPVDRAYSWYGMFMRNGAYAASFEAFLSDNSVVAEHGFYSECLANYYRRFGKDQILVLIHEHAMSDTAGAKETLAHFLEVDVDRFPAAAGASRVNRSYIPRARLAYALAARIGWQCLRYRLGMDWVVNLAQRVRITRLFGDAGPLPPMRQETRQRLVMTYRKDIEKLETLLQVDLDCWRA